MYRILLVFILVLTSLASYSDEPAECPNDINSELKLQISKLVKDDKNNILGLQFHITTLKMAMKVAGTKERTLEDYLSKQENILDESSITEDLVKIYEEYGISNDLEEIKRLSDTKGAKYSKGSTRLYNKNVSAYILSKVLNKEEGYSKTDAAILSVANLITEDAKKFGNTSAQRNLTNLSNRLAIYTGYVDPKRGLSIGQMESELDSLEATLKDFMDSVKKDFLDEFSHCFDENDIYLKTCKKENLDDLINQEFLNLLKEIATKSTKATFKSTKLGLISLEDGDVTINFDKHQVRTTIYRPKVIEKKPGQKIVVPKEPEFKLKEEFMCNGVPEAYRNKKQEKLDVLKIVTDCALKAVERAIEGFLYDLVDLDFTDENSVQTNSKKLNYTSDLLKLKKGLNTDEIDDDHIDEGDDQVPLRVKTKEEKEKIRNEKISSNQEKIRKKLLTLQPEELEKFGAKKINGEIKVFNRDKYSDSYFDLTLELNFTESQREMIKNRIRLTQMKKYSNSSVLPSGKAHAQNNNSITFANSYKLTNSSRILNPINQAKESVKSIMNEVETKILPGIFTGKCWNVGSVVKTVCGMIGHAVGKTVLETGITAITTAGTGVAALPGIFSKNLVLEAKNEGKNILYNVGIHSAMRAGALSIAKGTRYTDEYIDNREHIFHEFEKIGTKNIQSLLRNSSRSSVSRTGKSIMDLIKSFDKNQTRKDIKSLNAAAAVFGNINELDKGLICERSVLACD